MSDIGSGSGSGPEGQGPGAPPPGPGPEQDDTHRADPAPAAEPAAATPREKETNQWAMFIHFSLLAGWIVPLAGIVVPILLWQVKKDELPGIVPHAHIVMNWIVTSIVYGLICFILMFVVIGILGFIALAIVTLLYAIIGGIKANEGEIWEYPGTIIKVFK